MNCKWAEGHLSACLDGTLDPAVRDEVEAHVKDCTHCGSILDEFRHFDGLVRDLPRYEPSDELRQRIFGSPEFAAILHDLDGATPGQRGTVISGPSPRAASASAAIDDEYARGGHDRPLESLPIPSAAPAGGDGAPTPLHPAAPGVPGDEREHGGPPWVRIGLSVAAAVALLAGSGALIQQSLGHSSTSRGTTGGISDVGGYVQQPLPAGTRVIFERAGALWSAPEHGAGLAKQLTPPGVAVAPGWAVVPAHGETGGDRVAYVDLKTGMLHVVRSDDQRDTTVGQRLTPGKNANSAFWSGAEGQAILGGLAWAPNSSALAYLADDGTGHTMLLVAPMTGGSITRVTNESGVSAAMARWSPDSARVAFVQTAGSGQSIWDFNVAANQIRQLSGAAEPGGSGSASVRQLAWLGASAGPVVTWTSGDAAAGTITGVFSMPLSATAPHELVPVGTVFTAADFTAGRAGGTWLLGDGTALYAVSGLLPGRGELATVPGGVKAAAWSPDGEAAAYLGGDGALHIWIRAQFPQVATGVSAASGFGWAPDGSTLAYVANGQLNLVSVSPSSDQVGTPVTVSGLSGVTAFAWAPDGQSLAVAASGKIVLVSPAGATQAVVDAHASDGAPVWSTVR